MTVRITYGDETVTMEFGAPEDRIAVDGHETPYTTADARCRIDGAVLLACHYTWPEVEWPEPVAYAADAIVATAAWDEMSYKTIEEEEPGEPGCASRHGHDWQSPLEIVGGVDSNPGVRRARYDSGGIEVNEVCAHCGRYRRTLSSRRDETTVTYGEPDRRTLEWVASMAAESGSASALEEQLAAIRAHAVNATTRAIAADGIRLTHAQAEQLDDETLDWMSKRLDLRTRADTDGVTFEPRGDA